MPLLALVACHSDSDPEPTPSPVTSVASRTVLVYIEAKNNLGDYTDAANISQMLQAAQAGDLGDGRLIVFHSPKSSTAATTIKEITPEGIDTLYVYPEAPSAITVETMRDAWSRTKALAPAKEYGMVLWSHATGWWQDGISDADDTQMGRAAHYSYGRENSKTMNVTALASALEDQGLKFIYFDCCYMGNVETLYQMRHCADYFFASATEVPFDGMPYSASLKYLFADDLDLAQLAQTNMEYYAKKGMANQVTSAVVKASELDRLAELTAQVYAAYGPYWPDGYQPQCLGLSSYKSFFYDLGHFIEAKCLDEDLKAQWQEALNRAVLHTTSSSTVWGSYALNDFCGLSTYILTDDSDADNYKYYTLGWYADVVRQ